MNSIQNYNKILRGLNIASIDNNEKLSLQIIDWKTCDKEINEEFWQNALKFLSTLGKEEFLSTKLTSEEILYRLFNELKIKVFDKII